MSADEVRFGERFGRMRNQALLRRKDGDGAGLVVFLGGAACDGGGSGEDAVAAVQGLGF